MNKALSKIQIKNLRLRTIIGIFDWERKHKQDVIVNVQAWFDSQAAAQSDLIEDTVDYKTITKKMIKLVEESSYGLVEKLSQELLDIVMEDPRVVRAIVELDKPQALRFSDSVSLTVEATR